MRGRRRRIAMITGVTLLVLLSVGVVVARVFFSGARLAGLVERNLNRRIRGTVQIGSIDWPISSLARVVTGGFMPVTITDLQVKDDAGVVILQAPRATAEIDVHPAMLGRHDLIVKDLVIVAQPGKPAPYARVREVTEPYPVHEYDRTTISLVSAFYPKPAAAFRAGITAASSPVFDLVDYSASGVHLLFEFKHFTAEVWDAEVKHGFLRFDGSDPLAHDLYYSLQPTAPRGRVTIGGVAIDVVDVKVSRLSQLPIRWPHDNVPHGMQYEATGVTPEGAQVHIRGGLTRTWLDLFGGEQDLDLTVTSAGKLAERLSAGKAGGPDLQARFRLKGPAIAPRMELDLAGVDFHVAALAGEPPIEFRLERATAAYDMGNDSGYLKDMTLTGAGGEVHLAANLGLHPLQFNVSLDIPSPAPLEVGTYVPRHLSKMTGTRLGGSLHAFGSSELWRLDRMDLRLGAARLRGTAYRTRDGKIHANGIEIALGESRIKNVRGVIDSVAGRFEGLTFEVESTDLGRWLDRAGAPVLARRVRGAGRLDGPLASPRASAELHFAGVPVLDKVDSRLAYQERTLTAQKITSHALGGQLEASGAISFDGAPHLVGFTAQGRDLDLARLPRSAGLVRGTLSVDASASGALDAPTAKAVGHVRGLELAGDRFDDTEIAFASEPDGRRSISFELTRQAGGVLSAQALLGKHGELGGAVSLRKLPLESIAALGGKGQKQMGGRIDTELQLSGTLSAPTADGRVEIARGTFRDTFLGSASLDVERIGDGLVRVSGNLFQGKMEVDGVVNTRAPFLTDVTMVLRRVELDHLFSEYAERYAARGWVSGEVRWKGSLAAGPARSAPEVSAKLTEAVVMFDSEDASGRPAPIRLSNMTPLSLAYDGRTLRLLDKAVLHGPAGDFTLSGQGGMDGLAFALEGRVAVAMMAPYFKRWFDSMSGSLDVKVLLTGTPRAPVVTGTVDVSKVALRPVGQDTTVWVPAGKVEFTNDQLSVTGLSMVVVDEFSDERSDLHMAGGVKLHNFRPINWALNIDGELSGKMLLVLAPTAFASASGSAELGIQLVGEGAAPDIEGEVKFDEKTPLSLSPRGARREIAFVGGGLQFTEKLITLEDSEGRHMRAIIDDEGELTDVSGEISLENWRPVDVDVTINASDVPFRVPQKLELSLNLSGFRVVGGVDSGLEFSGAVEIVDGRYIQRFNPLLSAGQALKAQRSTETTEPVWEEYPLLGRARLDLTVDTRAFFVKNNVADIEMNGHLRVSGTPRRPQIEGNIRVEDGSFKFQGIRARFERTSGNVIFLPYRTLPDQNPILDLRSESDYQDISGQMHNIQLTLKGPLGNLDWDLTTNTGLNKSQTSALIFTGRTPEEYRRALGDEAIGATSVNTSTAGTDAGGKLAVADQVFKQLAGEWVSLLTEDSIKKVTKLDVARVEVGTSSLGFHAEKKIVESVKGVGEFERTLQGWSWDAHGEYRINDTVSAELGRNGKYYDDEAEEDVSETKLRLIWRKVLLP